MRPKWTRKAPLPADPAQIDAIAVDDIGGGERIRKIRRPFA